MSEDGSASSAPFPTAEKVVGVSQPASTESPGDLPSKVTAPGDLPSDVTPPTDAPSRSTDQPTPVDAPVKPPADADNTGTVAKHYNDLQETGLKERTKSRIFYLRNFNNWIKSMIIGDILMKIRRSKPPGSQITVLDLCSGKGGDLLKWKKGRIDRLVCSDIASTSVEQSESRYKEMIDRGRNERYAQKMFKADFITADCTKTRLKDVYTERFESPIQFDLTSCQFSLHYSFESYQQADTMLRNACECLRPGGYFIGTTLDGNEIVNRLRASSDRSFGNEVYRVSLKSEDLTNIPLFGAEYNFHLEGVVDCPEFIVYFPVLEKMAAKYDMELVYKKPLSEVFTEYVSEHEGRGLIGRMQALEPHPPEEGVDPASTEPNAYTHAENWLKQQQQADNGPHKLFRKVGTLSLAEWEATTVYLAFAFRKVSKGAVSQADSTSTDRQAGIQLGKRPASSTDTSDAKFARTT